MESSRVNRARVSSNGPSRTAKTMCAFEAHCVQWRSPREKSVPLVVLTSVCRREWNLKVSESLLSPQTSILKLSVRFVAIREDRTRGGRSTYQCSYTLPGTILNPSMLSDGSHSMQNQRMMVNGLSVLKQEQPDNGGSSSTRPGVPTLLQVRRAAKAWCGKFW